MDDLLISPFSNQSKSNEQVNSFGFCKSRRQTHRGEEHIAGVPAAIADP